MSDRVVLRFYISPSWDAHQYVNYVYAPEDWADMSEEEQNKFLDEEARNWMEQQIEYGALPHTPGDATDQWESGGDPDEPEEWF